LHANKTRHYTNPPAAIMNYDDDRIVRVAQKFLDSTTFTLNLVEKEVNFTLEDEDNSIKKEDEEGKRQSKI